MRPFAPAALALLLAAPALAQAPDDAPIQDNSFLIEEAYNQGPGVVQHISTYQRSRDGGAWIATFTQEWPAPSLKHQLSYTLAALGDDANGSGFGDVALNYRYQLLGDADAQVAIAPRFSLLLPTGDAEKGPGAGGTGLQVNLPVSIAVSPSLAAHSNAGFTYTRNADGGPGIEADTRAWNLGQSFVWLARPRFNALLEVVYTNAEVPKGPGTTSHEESLTVSPGIRWAYNFPSGLQI
ncbi:MAG TPA: transporter, partial [Thermoanaerobaculia bacterium]|nr:transporter [Thermoanaerobaculia bacterium]